VAFLWVLAVGFEVNEVIDGVREPGDQTEENKGCQYV
jgi:hypothetical protein